MFKNYNIFTKHRALLLSSLILLQVVCAEDTGAKRENDFASSISSKNQSLPWEVTTTVTTTTRVETSTTMLTTTTGSPYFPGYKDYNFNTGKMVTLLLVSFSIPVAFMALLFWRLQKEKKYLNARAGALIYREAVLVPSYTAADANAASNNANVIQMHSALYDTPPEYEEAIISSTTANGESEAVTSNKGCKVDELPPPSYSTVYM